MGGILWSSPEPTCSKLVVTINKQYETKSHQVVIQGELLNVNDSLSYLQMHNYIPFNLGHMSMIIEENKWDAFIENVNYSFTIEYL